MAINFSPWMESGLWSGLYAASPFGALPSPLWGPIGVPLSTYYAAATVGGWYSGAGEYPPGWANRFFADRAPTQQSSGGYPPALEDRAKDYVRKALGKDWMPDKNRYATAYDVYNTAQHAEISKSERAAGADGREKTVWDLADSLKDWMEIGDKRADYTAALETIRKSKVSAGEKLLARVANLLVPGSTEATKEAAEAAMARLKPAELPAERSPNAIMAAYIRKLGGDTVAQSLVDEVSAQVAWRGVPTKGRSEYIADLKKKGFKAPEAAVVYDKLLADKTDSEKREAMGKMSEVKTDKKDVKAEKEQYDQRARVAAMRAMDVKNEDELNALLGKYKSKNFSAFLETMRKDVEAGKIPKVSAGGGGGRPNRNPHTEPPPPPSTGSGAGPGTGPGAGPPAGPGAPAPGSAPGAPAPAPGTPAPATAPLPGSPTPTGRTR